jgi:hypothetical protein
MQQEQQTHLRLLTSSSINNSFDFCRSCTLKGGVRPFRFGWSSGVEVGKDNPLSRTERASFIAASSSSRFAGSVSSFSAFFHVDENIQIYTAVGKKWTSPHLLEHVECLRSSFVWALVRMDDWSLRTYRKSRISDITPRLLLIKAAHKERVAGTSS